MTKLAIVPDDVDPEQRIYPDIPCYVADDAGFRVAVAQGIASYEDGPTVELDTVMTKLRGTIATTP